MDLRGKTVVVTGGTSGIGRATALALARRGADVTVIGRDATRGAEIEGELRAAAGLGTFLAADLSLVAESRRVAAALRQRLATLDALILSAGVIEFVPQTTAEGLDRSFVINFLHKHVLAEALAPLLAPAHGRVVLVAADVPRLLPMGWRNFEGRRVYAGLRAVGQLHAASLALAQHLATTWRDVGISVTAIHPGQVDTGIYRSFRAWPWRALARVMRLAREPIERPVELLAWLAFAPEAAEASGQFFPSPKRRNRRRPLTRDPRRVTRVLATARAVAG